MPAPSLSLENVSKSYGAVHALVDVTLSVGRGECLALVGESGSGKTTLLRCINRLVEPDSGVVRIDGRDAGSLDVIELRRSIGYVPQEGGLLPHWRVRRNVGLVPWLHGSSEEWRLADDALEMVGLPTETFGSRWPDELSGGQRHRVAVARALAGGQSLMLLDEPFGALDAITRHDLQRMIVDLRAKRPLTIVLVTHDIQEAMFLADRVGVLRAGRLEQLAAPEALGTEPATPYVRQLLARAELLRS
ncbi:MAG TPA: ATP-binding cassette domain-containing protein [Gemmatimonadaceae bacterium]|nr:ATP-binding cassette domain-containing protein [Gemmatimonadaceae bacterium]